MLLFGALMSGILVVVEVTSQVTTLGGILQAVIVLLIPMTIMFFSLALVVNGIIMLRRERFGLANALSLIIGLGIIGSVAGSIFLLSNGSVAANILAVAVVMLFGYVSCMFMSYCLIAILYSLTNRAYPADFIVVHGSGLIRDNVPPLLAGRLKKGMSLLEGPYDPDGNARIVVSGGRGSDENRTEASAMAEYLRDQGVSSEQILLEDQSRTTYENLVNAKAVMEKERPDGFSSVLVTSNYHTFRTAMFARSVGLKADVVGSPTAKYYFPSAFLREFFALMVKQKYVHLILCILFIGCPSGSSWRFRLVPRGDLVETGELCFNEESLCFNEESLCFNEESLCFNEES